VEGSARGDRSTSFSIPRPPTLCRNDDGGCGRFDQRGHGPGRVVLAADGAPLRARHPGSGPLHRPGARVTRTPCEAVAEGLGFHSRGCGGLRTFAHDGLWGKTSSSRKWPLTRKNPPSFGAPLGIRTRNLRSRYSVFARVRRRPKLYPHAGLAVRTGSQAFAGVRSAWLPIWLPKVTRVIKKSSP
jgi:hypothetical protein